MHPEVDVVLAEQGGVASRRQLLTVLTRSRLDHEVARRHLVAPFPRAYCRPWDADDPSVLERAALSSIGPPAALSHVTALRRWRLAVPASETVHVTVPFSRHPVGSSPNLIAHRTRQPLRGRFLGGLPTVDVTSAITWSWPLLRGPDQRGPAIEAVRARLTAPAELLAAARAASGLADRSALVSLAGLLAAGCESELEIWGFLSVFCVPGLDHARRQRSVEVDGRVFRLDLAYDDERVAVELDGERYHSTREQRERDRRRDAALAAAGWLTLRFSHTRLHRDIAGCRRDTLRTLAARARRARD